jgi:cell wall-associated NlpC family hydrolase
MMGIFLFLFSVVIFTLTSCGGSRVVTTKKAENRSKNSSSQNAIIPLASPKITNVISHAKSFEGTRYKYGGTTKRGMDCSGLIYTAFLEEDIPMPRTSRAMSLKGERLYIKEVSRGDLLFFETNKNKKVINHVGLVVDVNEEHIYFIHASTSSGVIISSLSENYWNGHFVMARRIL